MTSPSSAATERGSDGALYRQAGECDCGWDGVDVSLCDCGGWTADDEGGAPPPSAQGRLDLRELLDDEDAFDASAASIQRNHGLPASDPRPGTKTARVLDALRRGEWVGPLEAFRLCGSLRFSGIVYSLRHDYGVPLVHRDVGPNENGVRWREFALAPEALGR
jgi:hypothetical protein